MHNHLNTAKLFPKAPSFTYVFVFIRMREHLHFAAWMPAHFLWENLHRKTVLCDIRWKRETLSALSSSDDGESRIGSYRMMNGIPSCTMHRSRTDPNVSHERRRCANEWANDIIILHFIIISSGLKPGATLILSPCKIDEFHFVSTAFES